MQDVWGPIFDDHFLGIFNEKENRNSNNYEIDFTPIPNFN